MKRDVGLTILFLFLTVFLTSHSRAQDTSRIPSYYSNVDFLLSTPGAAGSAIGGYVNPAVYGVVPGPELQLYWSDERAKLNSWKNWGLFTGLPHLGFGLVHRELHEPGTGEKPKDFGVTDYRIALAHGDRSMSFGFGYGWSKGYPENHPRDDILQVGTIQRPSRYASIGIAGAFAMGSSDRKGFLDVALRPFGDPAVTLFGDAEWGKKDRVKDVRWGTGAAVELFPGVRLAGKYFDTEEFTLGLSFDFGKLQLSSAPHYDKKQELGYTAYGVRLGYPRENIFDRYFKKDKRYLSVGLKGKIAYRKYRYFDNETSTLSDILFALEQTIEDSRMAGVALNLSGMNISRVMAWEIREKLKKVREAGKGVVVYIDQGEMAEYHLASVADRIVMDPQGMLFLPGYVAGRTYLRGTLDKLGLGVDEWRLFKYKSAFEGLSREGMSDADREQRQALIDDFYATVRNDVCASRQVSPDQFDSWINEKTIIPADSALVHGLVDTLGRWEDVRSVITSFEGAAKALVGRKQIAAREFPSQMWGERSKIAIVYGLGTCAMDEGIKARRLEKIFQRLSREDGIKAIVFRVDSPGGDALASDVVAEALRKCAEEKPVIVSQGNVAGSGGYYISMYGDTIVAAPGTVTGSIGVMGGWIWNKGLGSKLGLSSDHAQVGDHADLFFGIRLPFLGIQVPDRNLTDEERGRVEEAMRAHYHQFVDKVAWSRELTEAQVDSIGQGRVWSGIDGKENGLVDVIGGLDTAIALARQAAGIGPEAEVDIVEMPEKGLFKLDFLKLEMPAFNMGEEREWLYLKLLSEHLGEPLPMIPPDMYPE
ncbi:MAG: S49 family peptidase [Gemmatimonadota bacterium]|nr:MAG: S49 family peptidase [Gemmatimonadota bacterium]